MLPIELLQVYGGELTDWLQDPQEGRRLQKVVNIARRVLTAPPLRKLQKTLPQERS